MFQIDIDKKYDSVRIDRFLRSELGLTQSYIAKILRKGFIKINDKKNYNIDYRLNEFDKIVLYGIDRSNQDNKIASKESLVKVPNSLLSFYLKRIVYEDDNIIVINKHNNIASQGGSGIDYSLIDVVKLLRQDCDIHILHRLDYETSGLIVFAKNKHTAREIGSLFLNNAVKKCYIALLDGDIDYQSQSINHPISYDVKGEVVIKSAVTNYSILKKIDQDFYLVRLEPQNGRKHQLRIHCSEVLKSPIVGDFKYGSRSGIKKLQLYSVSINIPGYCNVSIADSVIRKIENIVENFIVRAGVVPILLVFLFLVSCNTHNNRVESSERYVPQYNQKYLKKTNYNNVKVNKFEDQITDVGQASKKTNQNNRTSYIDEVKKDIIENKNNLKTQDKLSQIKRNERIKKVGALDIFDSENKGNLDIINIANEQKSIPTERPNALKIKDVAKEKIIEIIDDRIDSTASCISHVNIIYAKIGDRFPYDINCISEMRNKKMDVKIIIGPIKDNKAEIEAVLAKLIENGYNGLKVIDLSKK